LLEHPGQSESKGSPSEPGAARRGETSFGSACKRKRARVGTVLHTDTTRRIELDVDASCGESVPFKNFQVIGLYTAS